MPEPVNPIPSGYTSVTPYLMLADVPTQVRFLTQAFDAIESSRHEAADGTIMHTQVRINGAAIMMGPAREPWKPMPASIYVYVVDCDTTYAKALAAGATSIMPPMNMFYGDRQGGVKDCNGNVWWIASHIEDVSEEESQRRARGHANKPPEKSGS